MDQDGFLRAGQTGPFWLLVIVGLPAGMIAAALDRWELAALALVVTLAGLGLIARVRALEIPQNLAPVAALLGLIWGMNYFLADGETYSLVVFVVSTASFVGSGVVLVAQLFVRDRFPDKLAERFGADATCELDGVRFVAVVLDDAIELWTQNGWSRPRSLDVTLSHASGRRVLSHLAAPDTDLSFEGQHHLDLPPGSLAQLKIPVRFHPGTSGRRRVVIRPRVGYEERGRRLFRTRRAEIVDPDIVSRVLAPHEQDKVERNLTATWDVDPSMGRERSDREERASSRIVWRPEGRQIQGA